MITTTYKCDRCGHEQTTPDQMWNINIKVEHVPKPAKFTFYDLTESYGAKTWCRPCVESIGLNGFSPEKIPNAPPFQPPSFEDQLREIIRDEVEAATGGRA